ncbi:unnamed protein product, partial [Didymodactylos carnosus]
FNHYDTVLGAKRKELTITPIMEIDMKKIKLDSVSFKSKFKHKPVEKSKYINCHLKAAANVEDFLAVNGWLGWTNDNETVLPRTMDDCLIAGVSTSTGYGTGSPKKKRGAWSGDRWVALSSNTRSVMLCGNEGDGVLLEAAFFNPFDHSSDVKSGTLIEVDMGVANRMIVLANDNIKALEISLDCTKGAAKYYCEILLPQAVRLFDYVQDGMVIGPSMVSTNQSMDKRSILFLEIQKFILLLPLKFFYKKSICGDGMKYHNRQKEVDGALTVLVATGLLFCGSGRGKYFGRTNGSKISLTYYVIVLSGVQDEGRYEHVVLGNCDVFETKSGC